MAAPGRRGPRPSLSVEQIAAATVRVADAEGLDAVSMQRVAKEFGYSTMSLYRYVATKDELMAAAVDHAAAGAPAPEPGEPWRAGMTRWADALWAVYLRHPWVPRVQTTAPPSSRAQLAWLEFSLAALTGAGLTGQEALSTTTFLMGAIRDLARITLDLRAAGPGTPYLERIAAAVAGGEFPALAAVMTGPDDQGGDETSTAPDLAFGLQRLLDGVEGHIRARG
ncbi:TetR/AcrR family transcriptional regulator [Actinokineospora pegani]|uniref:TetR/AcrR family transcriptional regulator n=1 Tax=Actinokineospora pegani TaxID=2654637 RepID=UPI001F1FECCF|nr:TetR/AcrR family transcriptional regulator [Actinokineospora pegani]